MSAQVSTIRRVSVAAVLAVCVALPTVVQAAPAMTNPTPGSTLSGSTETFTWSAGGTNVVEWWVYIGTSVGAKNIYDSGSLGLATSDTVNGLPTDGSTLYVRLWWRDAAGWHTVDVTYMAATSGGGGASSAEILEALRGVTQNWDKKLDSTNGDANGCNSDRFTCIFGGTAVRDNETGLVWERSLDPLALNWYNAISYCAKRSVGGRKGWHLPMLEQFLTLQDTSNQHPALPTGHPFTGFLPGDFWSATTNSYDPSRAWTMDMDNGLPRSDVPKDEFEFTITWCVRGGQVYDGQDLNAVRPN